MSIQYFYVISIEEVHILSVSYHLNCINPNKEYYMSDYFSIQKLLLTLFLNLSFNLEYMESFTIRILFIVLTHLLIAQYFQEL